MGIRDRVEAFPGDTFTQYFTTAIQILYYYDYLLTLPDEVPFANHPVLAILSPLGRSSTLGKGEKRGVSPGVRFVLSVLTESVFWLFILVNLFASTLNPF